MNRYRYTPCPPNRGMAITPQLQLSAIPGYTTVVTEERRKYKEQIRSTDDGGDGRGLQNIDIYFLTKEYFCTFERKSIEHKPAIKLVKLSVHSVSIACTVIGRSPVELRVSTVRIFLHIEMRVQGVPK